jgi:hypothetical protein
MSRQRSAVTDEPRPPLRDPEAFAASLHSACLRDIIYKSRCDLWLRENPGASGIDYLWLVLKPLRDENRLPEPKNMAELAAIVVSLPPPASWNYPFVSDG